MKRTHDDSVVVYYKKVKPVITEMIRDLDEDNFVPDVENKLFNILVKNEGISRVKFPTLMNALDYLEKRRLLRFLVTEIKLKLQLESDYSEHLGGIIPDETITELSHKDYDGRMRKIDYHSLILSDLLSDEPEIDYSIPINVCSYLMKTFGDDEQHILSQIEYLVNKYLVSDNVESAKYYHDNSTASRRFKDGEKVKVKTNNDDGRFVEGELVVRYSTFHHAAVLAKNGVFGFFQYVKLLNQ